MQSQLDELERNFTQLNRKFVEKEGMRKFKEQLEEQIKLGVEENSQGIQQLNMQM